MTHTGVVDIHAHYFPESYIRLIIEHGARCGVRYADGSLGPLIHVEGDIPAGPITPEFVDLPLRIAAMDRQGVQWQALSLTQPMVYFDDSDFALGLARAFNDSASAAHLAFPDRLIGLATLPLTHPRLEVCLPHAGGVLPFIAGRIDRGHSYHADCRHLPHPPSSYLKRFTYDTIGHSSQVMRFLIDLVGCERIMLGSDYCFKMGYERPVEVVNRLEGLDDGLRAMILKGNAARLLRLEP